MFLDIFSKIRLYKHTHICLYINGFLLYDQIMQIHNQLYRWRKYNNAEFILPLIRRFCFYSHQTQEATQFPQAPNKTIAQPNDLCADPPGWTHISHVHLKKMWQLFNFSGEREKERDTERERQGQKHTHTKIDDEEEEDR